MGRRRELQDVCNGLLASFVSRNNDLCGFWALGKFQAVLQSGTAEKLVFRLASFECEKTDFPETVEYYRSALARHLLAKGLPMVWVVDAHIYVQSLSETELTCGITLTTDRGKTFSSEEHVFVLPQQPEWKPGRRSDHYGPSNSKQQ